jgi:tRNA modification GTPase
VLPLPEVLVPLSSSSSPYQLDIQIPPSIQLLITPHTIFLLNKSDLVAHILPPTLSTASSFIASPHRKAPSLQVDEGYSTHLKLIPSDTSGSSQAWSTSLVTNQGTHEFVQGLAGTLKSRYVIYHLPPLLSSWGSFLFYFKSAFFI